MRKDGKGLYTLSGIKGKGATDFKNIIKDGQRRVQARLIEESRRPKQPIEPTVVDKQSRTFDNQAFDDGEDDELTQRLTDLRTINADLEAAGELPLDSYRTSGIPLETLREIKGLTENLRKTKSNMEAAYIELRKKEGDIGVIKD